MRYPYETLAEQMQTTHTRFTVHLVDPVRSRREALARGLQLRFIVAGFDSTAEAIAGAAAQPPHATVFTLRQTDGNGVTQGEAYRRTVAPTPLLLVHGTMDEALTVERRRQLMTRHRVDLWIPRQLDANTLEVLLWNELLQRRLPPERRVSTPTPPVPVARVPSFFARLTGAR